MFKVFLACVFVLCGKTAIAQSFDVASVRPHSPDDAYFLVHPPTAGRFSATGAVAKLLVMLAYDIQESQIVGEPPWLAAEKWDIEAKTDDGVQHTPEETRRMVQSLLRDRFALRAHRETQQRPAYVLTVTKGGPKFKPSERRSTNYRIGGGSISLERGELARFVQFLSSALGQPVVDRTGLGGLYDLSLRWDDAPIPEGGLLGADVRAAPGNSYGSIFTAIQDQLGLRLEHQQAPVDVLVIDRMERPSEN